LLEKRNFLSLDKKTKNSTNTQNPDRFKKQPIFGFLMAKKRFLSHNAMDKIIREVGAARVSNEAKAALAGALENTALELASEAWKFSMHAGRKTVTEKDISLAVK